MRPFPHPQRISDWLTQYWNILLGSPLRPKDEWLAGPTASVGVVGERVVSEVAAREGLTIERRAHGGLLEDSSIFDGLGAEVHPEIVRFYRCTSEYELAVQARWEPFWVFFGRLIDSIFARRLQQLCLPPASDAGPEEITSELIKLRDRAGVIRHTAWLRTRVATGQVMYSGFYYAAVDPQGVRRVKVVFPLPYGSATVIMSLSPLAHGGLRLASAGRRPGDPGFYFIVRDRWGGSWLHHLRSFEEFIELQPDPAGGLRVEHTMRLWGRLCYTLRYAVRRTKGPRTG